MTSRTSNPPAGASRRSDGDVGGPHGDIAILLCVHGGADAGQFDQALASMQAQTCPRARLFVYCDGPLNGALEAVLACRLDVIGGGDRVVRSDRSSGLPTGLNELISQALSDPRVAFMARMDADDLSEPTRLATQTDFLRKHPDVAVVGSWCIEFSRPGAPDFHKQLPTRHEELADFMLFRSPLIHPSVVFRREVFESGLRYNTSLPQMQDYDLWSRIVNAGFRIANIPEYLLWFRMEAGFFRRRAGWLRAWSEVRMRIDYARQAGKLRLSNYPRYAGLLLLRVAPVWIKKSLYRHLRSI